MMSPEERSRQVRALALAAGFEEVGIARAERLPGAEQLAFWLDAGRHGEMAYLERTRHLRADPRSLLPGARSVIVVAQVYRQARDQRSTPASLPDPPHPDLPERSAAAAVASAESPAGMERPEDSLSQEAHAPAPGEPDGPRPEERGTGGPRGRIARYAWGADYHQILRARLVRLTDTLKKAMDVPFETRICVDTAPLLEREVAALAGVGWIGKNTMVIHPRLGSYFFLGEIVTTLELIPTSPMTDRCGTCRRCLEACPTQAFIGPYRMDARRCIAYLTIEHRSEIPRELHAGMGRWVFGCDVCQDVCPYNRRSPVTREPAYELSEAFPLPPDPPLNLLIRWTAEQHRVCTAGSAMDRASPGMLRRNAQIALDNARRASGMSA